MGSTTTTTDRRRELLGPALGPPPDRETLRKAIVHTVVYADIFDYPLRESELHRYLIGYRAELQTVPLEIRKLLRGGGPLAQRDGYTFLKDRQAIVSIRQRRAAHAAELWPIAARYGQSLGRLPFVRMVAVTGALAMDNVEAHADVDYLIVTQPGRLWTCRALAILIVRQAAARGSQLCPNYFLSEKRLLLEERNLFAAHELVQMIPVTGPGVYARMRARNEWTEAFLPNASGRPGRGVSPLDAQAQDDPEKLRVMAERLLSTRPVDRFENWEMKRKIWKLSRQREALAAEAAGAALEASFSADWCKGHLSGHGRRTLEAYTQRVGKLEEGWR